MKLYETNTLPCKQLYYRADESSVSLNAKNYLSLDWHPKAKTKFFNDKAAEDFNQDESYHQRVTPKKQVIRTDKLLFMF